MSLLELFAAVDDSSKHLPISMPTWYADMVYRVRACIY